MKLLIKQELFKLFHQKSTYAVLVLQLVLMLTTAEISNYNPHLITVKAVWLDNFNGSLWGFLVLIYLSSTIFTQEFNYGTIKLLISKQFSRTTIYLSKLVTLLVFAGLLALISLSFSLLLFSWLGNSAIPTADWNVFWLSNVAKFFTTGLISSLVLTVALGFKSTGLGTTVGIIVCFVSPLLANAMFGLVHSHPLLRYNPINVMNLNGQVINPALQQVTLLSIPEYLGLILVYGGCLLVVGNYAFKRRTT
ncbi:ABC transporter permease [Fructilactobacillus carniphilus]|uniref:ABC transporter permease n=1 Tax=Fructilactobacillus carniphilus TaxID=2940297 RepID=A0ABY5BWP7_9LACO|nr:ABC transporter permease [Fructilactobacillus carniphilus]USS90255.1 ABC transporter permease [Fructilactobacillus carniphilus]